jgi:hypothetical protein
MPMNGETYKALIEREKGLIKRVATINWLFLMEISSP